MISNNKFLLVIFFIVLSCNFSFTMEEAKCAFKFEGCKNIKNCAEIYNNNDCSKYEEYLCKGYESELSCKGYYELNPHCNNFYVATVFNKNEILKNLQFFSKTDFDFSFQSLIDLILLYKKTKPVLVVEFIDSLIKVMQKDAYFLQLGSAKIFNYQAPKDNQLFFIGVVGQYLGTESERYMGYENHVNKMRFFSKKNLFQDLINIKNEIKKNEQI